MLRDEFCMKNFYGMMFHIRVHMYTHRTVRMYCILYMQCSPLVSHM